VGNGGTVRGDPGGISLACASGLGLRLGRASVWVANMTAMQAIADY